MNADNPPVAVQGNLAPMPEGSSERRFVLMVVFGVLAAVILLLAGLTIFKSKAKAFQAKAVEKGLEIAIKSYKTEYLRLPFITAAAPTRDYSFSSDSSGGMALLDILTGPSPNNPRGIRFWEASPKSAAGSSFSPGTGLIDPWNKVGYHLILDYDNDGHITDPEGTGAKIKADVLIYSAGPDGNFTTWSDNVCSWK